MGGIRVQLFKRSAAACVSKPTLGRKRAAEGIHPTYPRALSQEGVAVEGVWMASLDQCLTFRL